MWRFHDNWQFLQCIRQLKNIISDNLDTSHTVADLA